MCKHYRWPPQFWRQMGTREFYAWVEQAGREQGQAQDQPDSWAGTENSAWWQEARRRREEQLGR